MDGLLNSLASRREALGIRQTELAERVGITRQTLSALETGKSTPSTSLALRLARSLTCRVDDLFRLDDSAETVEAIWVEGGEAPPGARATLAFIDGRWVAHPIHAADPRSALTAADALVSGPDDKAPAHTGARRLELLKRSSDVRDTLLCAGCAPALGILAARVNERASDHRAVWLDAPSMTSLQLLRDRQVHIAGAHLFDERSGDYNVPEVRRLFAGQSMELINLVRWEAGIVVAAGNPKKIKGVDDLVRPDVTVVKRRTAAAASRLLARALGRAGLSAKQLCTRGPVAEGHGDVARLISLGIADAGIAISSAASSLGLAFLPLADERFDLVVPTSKLEEPRVARLLETLVSSGFRRDAESLGGVSAGSAGGRVAHTV